MGWAAGWRSAQTSIRTPPDGACPALLKHGFQEPSKQLCASRPGCGGHFLPWGPAVRPQPTPKVWPNGLRGSHSTLSWRIASLQGNDTGRRSSIGSEITGNIVNLDNLELMQWWGGGAHFGERTTGVLRA